MIPYNDLPVFRPIDAQAMESILPYLQLHKERSCDFSYGGILMWVDMFDYEYAIHNDTLYIKGKAPGNGEHTEKRIAFSMPLGKATTQEAVEVLRRWCARENIELEFSSVTPVGTQRLMEAGGKEAVELPSWEDYLYNAEDLALLPGKKFSKKRNHVNQFKNLYPDWSFHLMQSEDVAEIRRVTSKTIDEEASQSEEARNERQLADILLREMENGNPHLFGGVLKVANQIVAYTIGDIIGDTLFIHVEKAERAVAGSFEMINKCFAEAMTGTNPELKYINREDDAGDPGLRHAKQSYHPFILLKKYNVKF